jgi:hypothetical protein
MEQRKLYKTLDNIIKEAPKYETFVFVILQRLKIKFCSTM